MVGRTLVLEAVGGTGALGLVSTFIRMTLVAGRDPVVLERLVGRARWYMTTVGFAITMALLGIGSSG
jgi:hypothetical protein